MWNVDENLAGPCLRLRVHSRVARRARKVPQAGDQDEEGGNREVDTAPMTADRFLRVGGCGGVRIEILLG